MLADIFGVTVYTTDVPNSAALGGCYRAKFGNNFRIGHSDPTFIYRISKIQTSCVQVVPLHFRN